MKGPVACQCGVGGRLSWRITCWCGAGRSLIWRVPCRRDDAGRSLSSRVACWLSMGRRLSMRVSCPSTKCCTACTDSRPLALWMPRDRGRRCAKSWSACATLATCFWQVTRSVGGSAKDRAVDLRAVAGGGWSCSWARQGSAALLLSSHSSGLSFLRRTSTCDISFRGRASLPASKSTGKQFYPSEEDWKRPDMVLHRRELRVAHFLNLS